MKTTTIILSTLILSCFISKSQMDQFTALDTTILISSADVTTLKLNDNDQYLNTSKTYTLINGLKDKLSGSAKTILADYLLDLEKNAIIIIKHPILPGGENKKEIISALIHKENKKWSKYLLNTKKIVVVFIGGEETLENATIEIEKRKNYFTSTFTDLASLVSALGIMGGNPVPVRIVQLESSEIKTPCDIVIKYPGGASSYSVTVHEKSHFSFQAGISASQVDKKSLKIQNQQLIVSLDSTQKKEWKSNLIAILAWHPFGQDIDRLEPLWKRTKEHGAGYDFIGQRIGLFIGLQISKDPINSLYGGITFAVSKEFHLNFGVQYLNQLVPSITNIGNITSTNDAQQYAKRQYKGQIFFGIAFSPGQMLKTIKSDK